MKKLCPYCDGSGPFTREHIWPDWVHRETGYQSLSEDWRCPGCARSKFEILRWTLRFPKLPTRFWGWAGGYHRHHDHNLDVIRYGRVPPDGRSSRFPDTVICEQCNSADGTAKRKLALPSTFSFAPEEIRRFVTATPHGFHAIDYEAARRIFDLAQSR
ncbi:hypothetical protein [Brevundimonas diminuta]|uniref:hypothetical protein n=1 Tax=Brevundimonas diminuta TaxID=293 RepID=UPI001F56A2FC|nr:hypothetical protein [Brevundimonas diminuta]